MKKTQILVKKLLPHNFLAEKMILSSLILNFDLIELILERIPIEAFYFKNHQEIYKAIIFMHKNYSSIDILSLTIFLQENGLVERIGGIKVLLELIKQVPNLLYLKEYIRIVKEKFLRRSLIKIGYKMINSGYIMNLRLETILENLENEILNLNTQIKIKKTLSSSQLLNNMFSELKEKFLHPTLPGLSSGFSKLDSLTQGFQKSDLIIVAGRPSMGKTALSLNIALNSIKITRLPILFFSLEMSKEQLMYRIISTETAINQMKLKNGRLYQNDWIKLTKTIKTISKLPLFIDDSPNLTIQEIRSKIKMISFEQTELGLVIIDYLQLMNDHNIKNLNRVQELSQITRSLKNLAREFNIPILALSQLSRNVDNRVDQKPILSDLRESGSIEQDADLVLMLSNGKSTKLNNAQIKLIDLIIAKQRNGPIGNVQLKFDKNYTKFVE